MLQYCPVLSGTKLTNPTLSERKTVELRNSGVSVEVFSRNPLSRRSHPLVGVVHPMSRRFVVYYESRNRELKTTPIYECRCDERLKTNSEESTLLGYTGFLGELEHLQIETRLIDQTCFYFIMNQ
jgi:hypothetical protein